jgi:FtsP/CotA-like multicopper oxidase with cupredoxin domain
LQFEPKITLQAGEMVRWRMASASISEVLELTLDGCSFHLIAKDGVYLQDAPRTVPAIYLSPASRADVMIQCMDPGTYSLRSDDLTSGHTVNTTGTPAQPGFAAQSAIASVVVRASTAQPDTQPPGVNVSRVPRGFSPGFPNYLADLQRLPPRLRGSMQHWSVSLGVNGLDVNGVKYAPDSPLQVFQTGRVIEWQINPSHASGHQHPLHLHVWPFQITALPKQSGKNVYYQVSQPFVRECGGHWHGWA